MPEESFKNRERSWDYSRDDRQWESMAEQKYPRETNGPHYSHVDGCDANREDYRGIDGSCSGNGVCACLFGIELFIVADRW